MKTRGPFTRASVLCALALSIQAAGCGARSSILLFSETVDAGRSTRSGVDSGSARDSGGATDAGIDVGRDAGVDSGYDSGIPCNACGPVCPSPEICQNGFCADPPGGVTMCDGVPCTGTCTPTGCLVTLVAEPQGALNQPIFNLATDGTHVYWTDGARQTVNNIRLVDRAETTLAMPPMSQWANALTVDATNVYWLGNYGNSGSVKSVPIAGGAITTLAANLNQPTGLAVTATSVIWSDLGGLHSLTSKP